MKRRGPNYDDHFKTYYGPLAVVRACNYCSFTVRLEIGHGGGRGYGMREGNKARGRMIQHIKECHEGFNDLHRIP